MRNHTSLIALLIGLFWPALTFAQCIEGDCKNGQGTLLLDNGIKYVGQFKAGKYHGKGSCFWPNGGRYVGDWVDGFPHGEGERVINDSTTLIGWFENGRFAGQLPPPDEQEEPAANAGELTEKSAIEYTSAPTGCISGNCQAGLGVFVFNNGAVYTGEFLNGQINGDGICNYPDGSRFEGRWKNARPHGYGKMVYFDGSERLGRWENGEPSGPAFNPKQVAYPEIGCKSGDCINGNGVMLYIDGSRYEGKFYNHRPHGRGTMTYPNGDEHIGEFRDGIPHGQGALYRKNKEAQRGHWVEGEFVGNDPQPDKGCISGDCENGAGTYVFQEGDKYIGTFKNGLPHGRGTIFYKDGRRYEGEIQEGYLQGYGTLFTQKGQSISGYWKEGILQPKEVLTSTAPQPQTGAVDSDEPELQVWAVVIGVAAYRHMRVLQYSDDDAYRMYAFLKSPEGGALDDDHIRILVDEEATLGNIKRTLHEVFSKAGENDLIMMYYSGHGVPGALLPFDFNSDGINKLYYEEVSAILKRSRAKYKLFIADACHSGSSLAHKGSTPRDQLPKELRERLAQSYASTALIVSSKEHETSVESSGLRQGVFSYYLIKGLKGEADTNRDRYVNIRELYNYVSQNVREYTGYRQSPLIEGRFDENMPVSIRQR